MGKGDYQRIKRGKQIPSKNEQSQIQKNPLHQFPPTSSSPPGLLSSKKQKSLNKYLLCFLSVKF